MQIFFAKNLKYTCLYWMEQLWNFCAQNGYKTHCSFYALAMTRSLHIQNVRRRVKTCVKIIYIRWHTIVWRDSIRSSDIIQWWFLLYFSRAKVNTRAKREHIYIWFRLRHIWFYMIKMCHKDLCSKVAWFAHAQSVLHFGQSIGFSIRRIWYFV